MSGSCVTTIMVMPCSRFSRWKIAMISTLVRESSAPVGSSARMIRGSFTSARAMATRCCWPPESWLGWCSSRSGQSHREQRRHAPARAARAAGVVGVQQRQFHILQRAGPRQQVELLEHEADLLVANLRQLVAVQLADADPIQPVLPGRRLVEAPENVHQRRFAGAGRPHDRDEIAALDLERDALQHVHRHLAQAVVLHQILDFESRVPCARILRAVPRPRRRLRR